ncbi:hypothetical protein [Alkaliphilus crotonatoxidans]
MKDQMRSILIFLVILLVFSMVTIFFSTEATVKTFQRYASPNLKISLNLLNQYLSADEGEKQRAELEIIQTTLKNLNYDSWQSYLEYIELKHYIEIIKPNSAPQLIVILNLSKDASVLALYQLVGDSYVFDDKIEGLIYVKDLNFISLDEEAHHAMVIEQTLDERLGGFFIERFIEIYYFIEDSFKKVWSKTLYYEEIYQDSWINAQGEEGLWFRVVEETTLDYVNQTPFKINSISTQSRYQAQSKRFPEPEQFTLTQSNSYQQSYQWSSLYETFIIGEVNQTVFLTRAALLEDLEWSVEKLYGVDNLNYRLMTPKGEIFYLSKNKFKGILQILLEE